MKLGRTLETVLEEEAGDKAAYVIPILKEDGYLTQLEENNTTVHEIENTEAKEAVASFYEEYIGGDENKQAVFDMIQAAVAK